MRTISIAFCLIALCTLCCSAQISPNGHIRARLADGGVVVEYKTKGKWAGIMLIHTDANRISNQSDGKQKVAYTMLMGKRRNCTNSYRETTYAGSVDDDGLTIRAYNDGVAIKASNPHTLDIQMTSVRNNWIARWSDSYDEFFPMNRAYTSGFDAFGFFFASCCLSVSHYARITHMRECMSLFRAEGSPSAQQPVRNKPQNRKK